MCTCAQERRVCAACYEKLTFLPAYMFGQVEECCDARTELEAKRKELTRALMERDEARAELAKVRTALEVTGLASSEGEPLRRIVRALAIIEGLQR